MQSNVHFSLSLSEIKASSLLWHPQFFSPLSHVSTFYDIASFLPLVMQFVLSAFRLISSVFGMIWYLFSCVLGMRQTLGTPIAMSCQFISLCFILFNVLFSSLLRTQKMTFYCLTDLMHQGCILSLYKCNDWWNTRLELSLKLRMMCELQMMCELNNY